MLKFKSGATALASVSWLTGTTLFTLSIYGTGGRAFEDVFYDYLIEVHGTGSPLNELKGSLGKLLKNVRRALSGTLFEGGLAFYRPLILDVIQSIEKGGKVPISGEDALNVLKICDAAKMSIVQKRSINIKEVIEDKNNVVF
jgi:predicted dehydrogenase